MKRLLTLFLMLNAIAFAAVGKIAAVGGEVSIERSGGKLVAVKGFELDQNDRVVTGANGRTQLSFDDGSLVTIGKNSVFEIESFVYDNEKREGEARFSALQGAFRTVTGRIGKAAPENFKLRTRTATIGIRGTQILMNVGADGETIACAEGAIVVCNGGACVEVRAGEKTTIDGENSPPSPPQPYSDEEARLLAENAGGGPVVIDADIYVISGDEETIGGSDEDFDESDLGEDSILEGAIGSDETNELETNDADDAISRAMDAKNDAEQSANIGGVEEGEFAQIKKESLSAISPNPALDPFLDWGFFVTNDLWTDDPRYILGGWIEGRQTAESTIEALKNPAPGAFYNYNGELDGRVIYGDGSFGRIDFGSLTMNVDFGTGDIYGNMSFNSAPSGSSATPDVWSVRFDNGSISSNGFAADLSRNGALAGTVAIDGGNINGHFYGTGAEAIGGSFTVNGTTNNGSGQSATAEGVFRGAH